MSLEAKANEPFRQKVQSKTLEDKVIDLHLCKEICKANCQFCLLEGSLIYLEDAEKEIQELREKFKRKEKAREDAVDVANENILKNTVLEGRLSRIRSLIKGLREKSLYGHENEEKNSANYWYYFGMFETVGKIEKILESLEKEASES